MKTNVRTRLSLIANNNGGPRPSGWVVGDKFNVDHGGAIPPNVIEASNTRSVDAYQDYRRANDLTIHPARFPREIPEFLVNFLTDEDDLVLDPFGGSNMTGSVAEELHRRWATFEMFDTYLEGSVGRFDNARVINPFDPSVIPTKRSS